MTRKTSTYDMMKWLKRLHNYIEEKGITEFTAADINEIYHKGYYRLAKDKNLIKVIDKIISRPNSGQGVHLCIIDYDMLNKDRCRRMYYDED